MAPRAASVELGTVHHGREGVSVDEHLATTSTMARLCTARGQVLVAERVHTVARGQVLILGRASVAPRASAVELGQCTTATSA